MFFTKHYDNKMKEDEKGGNVAGMGNIRKAFKVLIEKSECNRRVGTTTYYQKGFWTNRT